MMKHQQESGSKSGLAMIQLWRCMFVDFLFEYCTIEDGIVNKT